MTADGTVTEWIINLKAGVPAAAQNLWERYFDRLVTLAWSMLRDAPRAAGDEEDVALDAFACFCRAALAGRYPQLQDRNTLWKTLVLLTRHKATDWARHERRCKRHGMHESYCLEFIISREPTPDMVVGVADECRRLLAILKADLQQVALQKMEGFTTEEIAARMNCTSRTIERNLRLIRSYWLRQHGSETGRAFGELN